MSGARRHLLLGRVCGFRYCVRCGLVALSNDATRRALAAPCRGAD